MACGHSLGPSISQVGGTSEGGGNPCAPDDAKKRTPNISFALSIQMPMTRRNRRSRGTRKMSGWNLLVKKTFDSMRAKNKKASFSDALKEASRLKKLQK